MIEKDDELFSKRLAYIYMLGIKLRQAKNPISLQNKYKNLDRDFLDDFFLKSIDILTNYYNNVPDTNTLWALVRSCTKTPESIAAASYLRSLRVSRYRGCNK